MVELDGEKMRTRAEVATMLKVSERTLRDWEKAGTGPEVVRLSRKTARYPVGSLSRFLALQGQKRCA